MVVLQSTHLTPCKSICQHTSVGPRTIWTSGSKMPVNLKHKTIRRVLLKQWRSFNRNVLLPLSMYAFIVIFILLSPLLIPFACLSYAVDQKRMYAAAERFRCIVCGVILGRASIERADDEWRKYFDELHRQNPGYRFRVERTVHAICTKCGKPYRFCEKTNGFIESQMPNPGEI
jgi:hypothetical protein